MRVERLDLTAFGPFSDLRLELGGAPFQIVHGPNEAGKSTTRRALEALLYGVPTTTPDAHLHPMPALRVGGRLRRTDGAELRIVRRKGRTATLVDETGARVDDEELERFLGGVARDGFTRLFSLSHEALTEGGRALCRDGGELGVSLFGAGLGAAVARLPHALNEEARAVWKPTGSTPPLNVALTAYGRLRHAAADAALAVETHADLDARLRAARAERDRLADAVATERRALGRLARLQAVLPLAARYRETARRRRALGEVQPLPPTARVEREAALVARDAARRALERAQGETERHRAGLEALEVPHALVAAGEEIGELHAGLDAWVAAAEELPDLRTAQRTARHRIAALRHDLANDATTAEAERPRPAARLWAPLEALADTWPRLDEGRETARRLLDDAVLAERRAEGVLDGQPVGADIAPLRAAVAAAQALGDADDALAALDADAQALAAEADRAHAALGVSCTPQQLERLPVPAAQTPARHGAALDALQVERRTATSERERARARLDEIDGRLSNLARGGTPPDEAELAAVRRRRDDAWARVRAAWAGGGADGAAVTATAARADLAAAYELAVTDADRTVDAMRRDADRVAELAQLRDARRRAVADGERAEQRLTAVAERTTEADRTWAAVWAPVGLTPATPTEGAAWLDRRARAVEAAAAARAARTRHAVLADARATRRQEVVDALRAVDTSGPPAWPDHDQPALRTVLAHALTRLEALTAADARRRQAEVDLERRRHELAGARRQVERADEAIAAWITDWTAATTAVGLDPTTAPATARAVRMAATELAATCDELRALDSRIEVAAARCAGTEAAAGAVVARVAPDLAALPPQAAVRALVRRHQAAIGAAAAHAELTERLADVERRRAEHQEALDDALATLTRLQAAAGCDDLATLADLEARAEAAQGLDAALADLVGRIAEVGAAPADRLLEETAGLDPEALDADVRRARTAAAALEDAWGAVGEQTGRLAARLEALAGDGAAARAAEDAQAALATVRREAERYATLRLAAALLDRQVEQHRREHGGPVLAAAHRLFGRLTCGSFTGLSTGWDERGSTVLLGLRPDGAELPVEAMSDGTRDALYLALRLATVEAFVDAHEPLPLVLDDVLLNLDDRRARAALRELDRLADRTQILFFTHHPHLVRLAESVVPAARRRTHDLRRTAAGPSAAATPPDHADVLLQLEL